MADSVLAKAEPSTPAKAEHSIPTNTTEFNGWMRDQIDLICNAHGGPMQFLHNTAEPESFVHYLTDTVKSTEATPNVPQQDQLFIGHPSLLSYDDRATTKPPPEARTCRLLADDILVNGFITQDNPLLVWLPDQNRELMTFKFWYVKGMARACTMLAMLKLCFDNKLDINILHAELADTLKTIRCRFFWQGIGGLKQVAFLNAKLSASRAICEKHSVLTWVIKLKKLMNTEGFKVNAHPGALIEEWNKQATQDSMLGGSKRVSVLGLLGLGDDVQQTLVGHHSRMGAAHFAFDETTFGNKKVMPGYQCRALGGGPAWASRLRIRPASVKLFVAHVIHEQEAKVAALRTKFKKERLESLAALSAFVVDVQTELMASHDIPLEKVQETLITPFVEGELNLLTELEGHLAERHPEFKPARITALKQLIEDHMQKGDKEVSQSLLMDINVAAAELSTSELNLLLDKAKHDLTQVTNYHNKLATAESAKYHEHLSYKVRRASHAKQTVMKLVGADADEATCSDCRKGKHQVIHFTDKNKTVHVLDSYNRFLSQIAESLNIPVDNIITCAFVNWAAMPAIKVEHQRMTAEFVATLLNNPKVPMENSGLLLMPQFCHTKGQLWKMTTKVLEMWAGKNVNMDRSVICAFNDNRDARDGRAPVQEMRVLQPTVSVDRRPKFASKHSVWGQSSLLQTGLVTNVPTIKTKDLVDIELLDPDGPPTEIEADTHASKTEKHAQQGPAAMAAILKAWLTPMTPLDSAIVVLDPWTHTCDTVLGFLGVRHELAVPAFYYGICDDAGHKEWAQEWVADQAREAFLEGRMPLTWASPMSDVPPVTSSDAVAAPQLLVLSWVNDEKKQVRLSEAIINQWKDHPVHGETFMEFIRQHRLDETPEKRPGAVLASPAKRIKVEQSVEQLGGTLTLDELANLATVTHEAVLSNLASDQSVKVSFTSDHKAYLSNSNDDRVIINAGTFLAGYRSGKWKPAGQEMDDNDVPYELVDGDSWVMHEGKFCRLLDVVIERRASKPDNATVAYYTIADRPTPDEPSMFVLNPKTESSLAFRPNMQDVKVEPGSKVTITQTHAAICLPPKVWAKFQQVKILWMSSWTQLQGLKPKRPMMVFVATLELPGKSVALLA